MDRWSQLKWWKSPARAKVERFIKLRRGSGIEVFPPANLTYRAYNETPFDKVKCVILGQDPYHTRGKADGLAFSVLPNISPYPPSLRNILREYKRDLGYGSPRCGSLTTWARQGVLLLNTCLSVELHHPLSHRDIGWGKLVIESIQRLSVESRTGIAFVFWGKQALEYRGLVDEGKHRVFKSSHPSPFSARRGFIGSRPYSRVNEFLGEDNKINWRLP